MTKCVLVYEAKYSDRVLQLQRSNIAVYWRHGSMRQPLQTSNAFCPAQASKHMISVEWYMRSLIFAGHLTLDTVPARRGNRGQRATQGECRME